jgi:hypothetical protein
VIDGHEQRAAGGADGVECRTRARPARVTVIHDGDRAWEAMKLVGRAAANEATQRFSRLTAENT